MPSLACLVRRITVVLSLVLLMGLAAAPAAAADHYILYAAGVNGVLYEVDMSTATATAVKSYPFSFGGGG